MLEFFWNYIWSHIKIWFDHAGVFLVHGTTTWGKEEEEATNFFLLLPPPTLLYFFVPTEVTQQQTARRRWVFANTHSWIWTFHTYFLGLCSTTDSLFFHNHVDFAQHISLICHCFMSHFTSALSGLCDVTPNESQEEEGHLLKRL